MISNLLLFGLAMMKMQDLKPLNQASRSTVRPNRPPMKKKPSYNVRRCKIRINIKKFENIILNRTDWGFPTFHHCLN